MHQSATTLKPLTLKLKDPGIQHGAIKPKPDIVAGSLNLLDCAPWIVNVQALQFPFWRLFSLGSNFQLFAAVSRLLPQRRAANVLLDGFVPGGIQRNRWFRRRCYHPRMEINHKIQNIWLKKNSNNNTVGRNIYSSLFKILYELECTRQDNGMLDNNKYMKQKWEN